MNNEDWRFYIVCVCLICLFIWCCMDFAKKNKIGRVVGVVSFAIGFVYFQSSFLQRVGANTVIIKMHIEENGKKEIVTERLTVNPFYPVSVREKILQERWEHLKNDMKQNPKIVKIELI